MTGENSPDWRKAQRKRNFIVKTLTVSLLLFIDTANGLYLSMYHYPIWIIVPFLIGYFGLGVLGISFFWSGLLGFYFALRRDKDRYDPEHSAMPLREETRIAILLPVYHEDARRVAAGAAAIWEDLLSHPEAKHFDYFILSDSRRADSIVQEQFAVHWLQREYPGVKFFYRHRGVNSNAKLGNIADFIRRWAGQYKYMLMMDADSIIPADSIIRMARIMEGNDKIALLQAQMEMVYRNTLYAKLNRYIISLTFRIGMYGIFFSQMGNGYYYGHNAMLRTSAFIKACPLPSLKKIGPYQGGKPLSHDFLEASLLVGAGYEVWNLPYLNSYEELPTNFIDDMQREMRWMIGALQWLRVFRSNKITLDGRMRLFLSAGTYIAPIFGWIFFFLALFGLRYIFMHPIEAHYFYHNFKIIFGIFFSLFFIILFVQYFLAMIYYHKNGRLDKLGGLSKATFSYFLYLINSLISGPILMAQMTKMLWYWIRGEKIQWGTQNRGDREISFSEAWRQFSWMTGLGITFLIAVKYFVFNHYSLAVREAIPIPEWGFYIWYIPMLSGLILAPFIVRFTSRRYPMLERLKWLLSPTDSEDIFVLRRTIEIEETLKSVIHDNYGFLEALIDPIYFHFQRKVIPFRKDKNLFWKDRLDNRSIDEWSEKEKRIVLNELGLLTYFHEKLLSPV